MFKKILVASDLSENSEPALRTALELAGRVGAQIVVVHVAEPPFQSRAWFVPLTTVEATLYRDLHRRQEEAARAQLGELVKRLAGSAAPASLQTMVLAGLPADLIPQTALELEADLIVMGTHGRTGVRHALLGSIAERVVRTARCPVLTVRSAAT